MAFTPMLRTLLAVVPFTLIAALLGLVVMIPVTWIVRDIRPIYAVARMIVRAVLALAGVRVKVAGEDPWRAPQPCVYICNHSSNLDPPIVFVRLPRIAPMAKASVFRWPLFGYALRMADFIPVERGRAESRKKAIQAGVGCLQKGISLLIFPEGTRSPDGNLLPFRPGPFTIAIEAQVPIVPMTLTGTREIMPKGQLAIRPGRVRLTVHSPIPTRGLTPSDRDGLMRQARAAIESALVLNASSLGSSNTRDPQRPSCRAPTLRAAGAAQPSVPAPSSSDCGPSPNSR